MLLASTVAASGCHCRHCHCHWSHWFFLAGKTIDEEFSHFVHMHWLTVRFNLINSLSHSYNRSSCSELGVTFCLPYVRRAPVVGVSLSVPPSLEECLC